MRKWEENGISQIKMSIFQMIYILRNKNTGEKVEGEGIPQAVEGNALKLEECLVVPKA